MCFFLTYFPELNNYCFVSCVDIRAERESSLIGTNTSPQIDKWRPSVFQFSILTSMITHVFLWHRKDIKRALFYPPKDDVHNRLMQAYHNVPTSWYMSVLAVSMIGSIWLITANDSLQLPIWGFFLAVIIGLVFLVPVGVLKAVSDTSIGLNVITE